MGTIRKTPAGNFELRIAHALLPKPRYWTFDDRPAAERHMQEIEQWLKLGVLPAALAAAPKQAGERLTVLIQRWRNAGQCSPTDDAILGWLLRDPLVTGITLDGLTYPWCEAWVADLKLCRTLAPSTIRQRVQALSRALDWHIRSGGSVANPLKLLPRGYSVYSAGDARALQATGREARRDQVRERRLLDGEETAIRAALAGEKRPDRERPLADDPEFRLLFELILQTGVRLREAYTLRREDVGDRVLRIKTTKQRNGQVVYRDVPMRPALHAALAGVTGTGLVFSFWDGDDATLAAATNRLSHRFTGLFRYAGCEGLTEHDLRHEATCRWFEQRDPAGRWMFRPEEINKIMGWSPNSTMATRYASFRAESLADRLWG